MDIPVESLVFRKCVMATMSTDLRSFARSMMSPMGIDHFSYCRNYPGGRVYCMTTDPDFSELYVNEKLYNEVSMASIEFYQSGYYLWNISFPGSRVGNAILEKLGIEYGLTIIRNNYPNYCEFYHYGKKGNNPFLNHFFINKLNIFEGIACLFNESFSRQIAYANANRIIFPESSFDSVYTYQSEEVDLSM